MNNPIFTQLVKEYQRAGRSLPWGYTVKPRGTIGILSETSQGMNPTFDWMVKRKKNPVNFPVDK